MKKHRAAVVGCGAMGQGSHLPNLQANPRVELVSACDVNAETAEYCRRKFGAGRADTDWRAVVEADDVDFIVLATTHDVRGEVIIPALERGKPVYTEKPLAPSTEEMMRIVRTARKTGVPVCVGHNRRSSPAVLEFRRLVAKAMRTTDARLPSVDRSAGRALLPEERQFQLMLRVNDDSRSWKYWAFFCDGGILFAEMVHFVDIALWLNPAPPVRVFADGSPRGNFTLVISFADGSRTTLVHSMVGNFDYPKELFEASVNFVTVAMDQHIEVRQAGMRDEPALTVFPFTRGDWAREQGMTGWVREVEAEMKRAEAEGRAPRQLGVNKGHYEHMDRFLTHIEGKGENPCDIEGAVAVNRVTLKLVESARLGMPVAVNPEDWHIPAPAPSSGR